MQDSREKKQCLIFVRNNANDTADRIEAYAFVSEIVFYDGNIEVKLLYDDFLKELLKVAEEREVSSNG